MKIHRILCCCGALALPQLASADLPFSGESFGRLEATLTFCAQVNPRATAQYESQLKVLVKDLPQKEISKVRDTTEYREAYDSISAELGKVPKDQAIKACTADAETR